MRELGLYVHIPYCSSKCAYCSFTSSVNFSTIDDYVCKLCEEIEKRSCSELVTSVYIGGGTPSVLKNGQITQILAKIRQNYAISDNCEITVEGNPESITNVFLAECKVAGVNRLSIGLQCADNAVLKKAGRKHTVEQFVAAVKSARNFGFDNISADLIIGLEGETDEILIKSLTLLTDLEIPHVSIYSLSVEKGCIMYTKSYRPDEDKMADQYDLCAEFLKNNGFKRYEVSNFARNGMVSNHNNKYWKTVDYLGFGVAAHSCYDGVRSENTLSIAKYLGGVTTVNSQKLTLDDEKTEFLMLGLRLSEGISLSDFTKKFGEDIEITKFEQLKKLYAAGVVKKEDDRLSVTDKGVYVLNYIITELL